MKKCRNKRCLSMLMVMFLLFSFCVVVVAQDMGGAEKEPKVLTAVEQKMLKNISVDFRETPIDDVIRAIAQQADLDIVKGPEVTGNVTATLTDVPLAEALSQILSAYGYGYVPSENMIRIVPASQLTEATEKLVSKVYRIVYADVTEVEKALTKVISQRGSISSNPGTSNLMITDTESKIAAIDAYIEEIDRKTAQILVEARIYDVSNTDALDLGVKWNNVGRNTGRGTERAAIGTGTSLIGGPVTGFSRSDPFVTGEFGSSTSKATGTTGTLDFGILTQHMDIDMLITAAQEEGAAKLLANPRILVLDNELATFKAVREIPYQQLQQGGYQSYGTTEFKEVGVELQVTPHLAKDGMIRMRIAPVFSVYVRDVDLQLTGTSITMPQPVVDTREADTIALIEDGDTVVIGGLRKEEVTQEISRVPLLSDIPILGELFKYQGENTVNSELVVFITPRIIEEPVLSDSEVEHLEQTNLPNPKPPVTKIDPTTRKLK